MAYGAYKTIIEPTQQKHMEQVVQLLQAMSAYLPPKESYGDIWQSFINQPHVRSVVATENDGVVGYGAVVFETKIRGGKIGHVEDIVSHPNRRNKGIGKMVVNALYEIARENKCYKVVLQCQQNNVFFYEKCSFNVGGSAMQRFVE